MKNWRVTKVKVSTEVYTVDAPSENAAIELVMSGQGRNGGADGPADMMMFAQDRSDLSQKAPTAVGMCQMMAEWNQAFEFVKKLQQNKVVPARPPI
jgi:hypothetical protein